MWTHLLAISSLPVVYKGEECRNYDDEECSNHFRFLHDYSAGKFSNFQHFTSIVLFLLRKVPCGGTRSMIGYQHASLSQTWHISIHEAMSES